MATSAPRGSGMLSQVLFSGGGGVVPRTLAAPCTQRYQVTGPREAVRPSLGERRGDRGCPPQPLLLPTSQV